jgi:inosose dehydratase
VAEIRLANAPVSFGVFELTADEALLPSPDEVLDAMVAAGYEGTELGPPGYLGDAEALRGRLERRGLALVGAFIPLRLTDREGFAEDLEAARSVLRLLDEAAPFGVRPKAVLADAGDAGRTRYAGRIIDHPETWLSSDRVLRLVDRLHEAARVCRDAGFDAVVHPHAGTYIETEAETIAVVNRIDGSLLGLCLDSGHAAFGGADAAILGWEERDLVRHVHLKDCSRAVLGGVAQDDADMREAWARDVFVDLGTGDADIPAVVGMLRDIGYGGWAVVEQDRILRRGDSLTTLTETHRRNREYLRELGL